MFTLNLAKIQKVKIKLFSSFEVRRRKQFNIIECYTIATVFIFFIFLYKRTKWVILLFRSELYNNFILQRMIG